MKIAIIGHKRIPSNEGGIEKGVEQHAVRMVTRGHQVEVYNRGGHNIYGSENDEKRLKYYKGVRIITVPTCTNNALTVPIYSLLSTLRAIFVRYDVVSYRASGSCVMIPLAKLFGLRCIASLHGIDSQRAKWGKFAKWYLELGEKMAAKYADELLVLSKNMQRYIWDKYHRKTILFANGIDRVEKVSDEIIRTKYGLKKDEYILFLSRIVPEKGLHYLVKAYRSVDSDKKLVIAGGIEKETEYIVELKKIASEDPRIIFTGFTKGGLLKSLYSNAYVYVLPSDLEGMANSLLEGMGYGNCCLVSDIPENTEVVEDKAVTFRKGDVEDLRMKLQNLVDNPSVVQKYKSEAADFILAKYNWDDIVTQMLGIYEGKITANDY